MYANDEHNSKFTRGEKCIFFHIVLVFVAILILLIIFLIHLYVVKHTEKSTGNTRRSGNKDNTRYPSIGVVYVDMSPVVTVCNTLLLRAKWSICPANCAVTRTHPELAFVLMRWRIDYGKDAIYTTNIQRSVPHPHFNKDTFSNNIGLFEHVDAIPMQYYAFNFDYNGNWEHDGFNLRIISREKSEGTHGIIVHQATYIKREKCVQDISFIGDVRNYEYCIAPKNKPSLVYGALVILNKEVMGIYSWGERKVNQIPCVVLNITAYRDWIKTIF